MIVEWRKTFAVHCCQNVHPSSHLEPLPSSPQNAFFAIRASCSALPPPFKNCIVLEPICIKPIETDAANAAKIAHSGLSIFVGGLVSLCGNRGGIVYCVRSFVRSVGSFDTPSCYNICCFYSTLSRGEYYF